MVSNITASPRRGNTSHWEDWGNLLLAAWLFVSPWALQFAGGTGNEAAVAAATWNAWISAVVVGVIAVMALYQLQQWEEWTNAVVSIWIAVSPWAVGFRASQLRHGMP